ncbi:MAG: group II intron maturase-specific domain-containing protein [Bacillota bacterium]
MGECLAGESPVGRVATYFHVADALSALEDIEGWLYRRLRACVWKQWKRPPYA